MSKTRVISQDIGDATVLPADLDVSADNTTADATTGHHGLLLKLGGGSTNYLRADGTWNAPPGTGGGTGLLAVIAYATGSDGTTASTSSATIVDADATNLAVTFTAPASSNVLIRLSSLCEHTGSAGIVRWGLRESTTTIAEAAVLSTATTLTFLRESVAFYLTGLSAGSHTYKWAYRTAAGTAFLSGGPTYGKSIIEVWSAP